MRICPNCDGNMQNEDAPVSFTREKITIDLTIPAHVCRGCGEVLYYGPYVLLAEEQANRLFDAADDQWVRGA